VLGLLLLVGLHYAMGVSYYAGLFVAACLAVYQLYIARDRDTARCFQAFLNNHCWECRLLRHRGGLRPA